MSDSECVIMFCGQQVFLDEVDISNKLAYIDLIAN
jgi:hypothetical protein